MNDTNMQSPSRVLRCARGNLDSDLYGGLSGVMDDIGRCHDARDLMSAIAAIDQLEALLVDAGTQLEKFRERIGRRLEFLKAWAEDWELKEETQP